MLDYCFSDHGGQHVVMKLDLVDFSYKKPKEISSTFLKMRIVAFCLCLEMILNSLLITLPVIGIGAFRFVNGVFCKQKWADL